MKKFFGSIYLNKEGLENNQIYYPIRVDYYKIQTEEASNLYGIEVVKTEYKTEQPNIEKEVVEEITNNEIEINELLQQLKCGEVTPRVAKEMVAEVRKALSSN